MVAKLRRRACRAAKRRDDRGNPGRPGPPREGDVRDSQADTTRAVADLGHEPRFTLEEGLRLTFDWYRQEAAK